MVRSLEGQQKAAAAVAILPYLVPVIAAWRMLDWRAALPLSVAWVVLLDQLGRRRGTLFARRAVQRFNEKFPEGSAARPEALQVLAGLHSMYTALGKMKQGLGLPGEQQWVPRLRGRRSPSPLSGPSAPAPTGSGAATSAEGLHLGSAPAPSSPERSQDFLPLELPGQPGPQPPPSDRFVFVPIEPVARPGAGLPPADHERAQPGPTPQADQQPRDPSDPPCPGDAPPLLAGPHNAELAESADGVLALRPSLSGMATPARWRALWQLLTGGEWRLVPCASISFDRNRGRRARFFLAGLPGQPLGRLPEALRKPRPLLDIAAVQLAAHSPDGRTCRLRLRLHDERHPVLELAPHAETAWARQTAERLARFLGVPLEDQSRPGT
jgi:hypothetical protein